MSARPRRQPEQAEQRAIVQLLRSLGAEVYVFGTKRPRGDHPGTMQSPGIPDVEAFIPRPRVSGPLSDRPMRRLVKIEVKAAGGRLRPAQAVYQQRCQEAGIAHVVGGLDVVIAWLCDHGYARRDQFGHYRQEQSA